MADTTGSGSAGTGSAGSSVARRSAGSRPSQPRTRAQIEADLAATRDRLTNSIEELIDQVHPQRVKERQIASAKRLAKVELDNAKSQFFYANGELRTNRLAAIGGAVAGFVTFVMVVRRIVRGGKRRKS